MQALGVAAATLGAFGLAVGTTPAGQEVLTAAQQTTVSQRQNGKVNNRGQQQQTQQRQAQRATYRAPQGTLPGGGWNPLAAVGNDAEAVRHLVADDRQEQV